MHGVLNSKSNKDDTVASGSGGGCGMGEKEREERKMLT